MKSNELRIGNWVYWDGEMIINAHNIAEIDYFQRAGNPLDVKGIPLTEEWLIRFGFEYLRPKKGTLGVYSNGKAKVCLSNGGNVYTMRGKSLPYVHTLQNWYYYDQLTSEELKTKE